MKKVLIIVGLVCLLLNVTGCEERKSYIVVNNSLVECEILEARKVSYLIEYEYEGNKITKTVWMNEVHILKPSVVSK